MRTHEQWLTRYQQMDDDEVAGLVSKGQQAYIPAAWTALNEVHAGRVAAGLSAEQRPEAAASTKETRTEPAAPHSGDTFSFVVGGLLLTVSLIVPVLRWGGAMVFLWLLAAIPPLFGAHAFSQASRKLGQRQTLGTAFAGATLYWLAALVGVSLAAMIFAGTRGAAEWGGGIGGAGVWTVTGAALFIYGMRPEPSAESGTVT